MKQNNLIEIKTNYKFTSDDDTKNNLTTDYLVEIDVIRKETILQAFESHNE